MYIKMLTTKIVLGEKMKKKLMITILLVAMSSILLCSGEESENPTIATMSWEDGYETIYLQAGSYHFEFDSYVSTTVPFDETNIWLDGAIVVGEFNYDGGYNLTTYPISNQHFGGQTETFTISESGNYSVKAGTYACWAVIVHSNTATLIRTALRSND